MKSKVDELKAAYDREECPCLEEYDPHTVASLLKQYLRELPENLLGRDLAQRFEDACGRQAEAEKVSEFQKLLAEAAPESRLLLSWLVTHMDHVIAREADTKMNIQNISIVLNPTIQVRRSSGSSNSSRDELQTEASNRNVALIQAQSFPHQQTCQVYTGSVHLGNLGPVL